jgi:hypothetical protein
VLDHPAGGNRCAEAFRYGFGGEGFLVALFCQEGSFQLSEGQGPLFGVIGFQLLGQLADGGGELLGLDAQLPERSRFARRTLRCDALQRTDRPCGLWRGGITGGGKIDRSRGEDRHGGMWGMDRMAPMGAEGFRNRRMQQARPRDRRMG